MTAGLSRAVTGCHRSTGTSGQVRGPLLTESPPATYAGGVPARLRVVVTLMPGCGLDKGCVRCPESDTNEPLSLPAHRGSRRGWPPGSPRRPPEYVGGRGLLWSCVWPRVRGPVDAERRDVDCPVQATPRWLSGTERGVSASPSPRGRLGAAARRVWCRRRRDPGTRHRSTATGSGCTTRSAGHATSCAVRQQGAGPCSFTAGVVAVRSRGRTGRPPGDRLADTTSRCPGVDLGHPPCAAGRVRSGASPTGQAQLQPQCG
jgi:hypothetical protein